VKTARLQIVTAGSGYVDAKLLALRETPESEWLSIPLYSASHCTLSLPPPSDWPAALVLSFDFVGVLIQIVGQLQPEVQNQGQNLYKLLIIYSTYLDPNSPRTKLMYCDF